MPSISHSTAARLVGPTVTGAILATAWAVWAAFYPLERPIVVLGALVAFMAIALSLYVRKLYRRLAAPKGVVPTAHFAHSLSARLKYVNEVIDGAKDAGTYKMKLPYEEISLASLGSVDPSRLTSRERDALVSFIEALEDFNRFAGTPHDDIEPGRTAALARHRLVKAARALDALTLHLYRGVGEPLLIAAAEPFPGLEAEHQQSQRAKRPGQKSIADLFDSDFSNCLRQNRSDAFTKDGKQYPVDWSLCLDSVAKTMFLALWLPHSDAAYELCLHLATEHKTTLDEMRARVQKSGIVSDTAMTYGRDHIVSSKVYIYHQTAFSDVQRGEIVAAFEEKGASAILRGPDYAYAQALLGENRAAAAG